MFEFAGWDMPVQYTGILSEHRAVRSAAGLFDVSHMGEIEVGGKSALEWCQKMTSNDLGKLGALSAQYTLLLNEAGGILDDVIVTRIDEDRFLFCTNASNTQKIFAWLEAHREPEVEILDRSDEYALLSLQGPLSQRLLEPLAAIPVARLNRFQCAWGKVCETEAMVSRTGYTGEDGFEIYLPWSEAEKVWIRLCEKGKAYGLLPAGLGARDTLRMEKGYCLYGHEIDQTTSPLEAGLEWVVGWRKGFFIGRDSLEALRISGLRQRLFGVEMTGSGIPRRGSTLFLGDERVGELTSGGFSPSLENGIGLAYGSIGLTSLGTVLDIAIRERRSKCRVVRPPFFPRLPAGS